MKCIICKSHSKLLNFHNFFRHLDFQTIKKKIYFYKCNSCQLVFNPKYLEVEKISKIKTKLYLQSNQTQHKLFSKKKKLFATRAFFQAQVFKKKKILNNNVKNVLDFGCFDGLFLKEVSKIFKNIKLYGFDTNFFLKKIFLLNKNKFISSEHDLIKHKFDIIFFSFSIFYIYSLNNLFENILKKILNENGSIVVQIPNIYKNFSYALYGDQRFIPTKVNLINLFSIFGYRHILINDEIFSKDIILIFKKRVFKRKKILIDSRFLKLIDYIDLKRKKLINLSGRSYSIFGTTISAAFYDSILNKKNLFFVDENIYKTKNYFRGKKVIHPINLYKSTCVIIPKYKGAENLIKRLKKKYKANFILL